MNQEILKRVDDFINGQINNGELAGASLLIQKDGETVYRENYGLADKEKNIPMADDSIFRLYSMTKPITAAATMILVEKGKLNLSDSVYWFLPGFANQKVLVDGKLVDANREINIHDLLTMTAGLVYPDMATPAGAVMQKLYDEVYDKLIAGNPTNTVDLCNLIGQQPLAFQPGEGWCYSTCADVLGGIIEVVSGKKFRTFLMEEIFEPLGMVDTDFYVPEEKQNRFTQFYEYKEESKSLEPCTWQHLGLSYMWLKAPAFESGGAGLVSTISDYAKFASMLLQGGTYNGVRILSRKSISFMSQNHLTPKQMETYNWEQLVGHGYGCLMRVLMDPCQFGNLGSVGEFGWDGWCGNYMMVDPEENLMMIYAIQKCGGNGHRQIHVLRNIIYSALE